MAGTRPKVWWLVAGGLINHIVRSLSARYQLSSPSLHFASVEVGNIAIIDFARQLAAGGCSAGCSAAVLLQCTVCCIATETEPLLPAAPSQSWYLQLVPASLCYIENEYVDCIRYEDILKVDIFGDISFCKEILYLCLRAPVALSTASAGHMEERVQLKLKPTTYIK